MTTVTISERNSAAARLIYNMFCDYSQIIKGLSACVQNEGEYELKDFEDTMKMLDNTVHGLQELKTTLRVFVEQAQPKPRNPPLQFPGLS